MTGLGKQVAAASGGFPGALGVALDVRREHAALETVDIPAVEIMRSGGPVKAIGSPVGGDFYTREELEGIAAAHLALGEEIRAPIKLGHSDRQQLLANSGLTSGEMPAAGWLDSATFRVEDDPDTGAARLVADAKAVPKKLADLMETGAYRTRSSEIRSYSSQKTQQEYPWIVDGLALLGEKVPAIQTLDDVFRLYERAELDQPAPQTTFVVRHNTAPDTEAQTEIVTGAESRSDMPDPVTITAEDLAPLAEKLGVEGDVTVEALTVALEERETARQNELDEAKTKALEAETRQNEAQGDTEKRVRKLEADLAEEQKRRFEMERDNDLTAAAADGRIDPGDLDDWKKDYEANQDGTRRVLARLKPDPDLVRELGREDGDVDGTGDAAYRDEASSRLGIASEALL